MTQYNKPVLLSNPDSAWNKTNLDVINALANDHNLIHIIPQTKQNIVPALQTIKKHAPDLLIINGGSGTISAIITALQKNGILIDTPPIMLLRGGKLNIPHHSLSQKGSPDEVLRSYLNKKSTQTTINQSTLEIHINQNASPICGFSITGGAIPRLIKQSSDHNKPVMQDAFKMLGTLMFKQHQLDKHKIMRPTAIHYSYDSYHWRDIYNVCFCVSSLSEMPASIKMNIHGTDHFAFAGLNVPYRNILWNMFKFRSGASFSSPTQQTGFFRQSTNNRLRLKCRIGAMIDGVLFDTPNSDSGWIELDIQLGKPYLFNK